jgi:hypothetical protein
MLVGLDQERRIEASSAERGPKFTCPNCKAPVILKKGRVRTHHFAHKPPTACTWAVGETAAHMRAKNALCEAFRQNGRRADVEVEVLSTSGDRRADVVVWSSDGKTRVAFEIQHQPLSFEDIEQRTRGYIAANVPVLWMGLLSAKAIDGADLKGGNLVIERYPPRQWEKWAHAFAFKNIWFMDEQGCLWRGVLTSHQIEVPYSSWYNSDGSEESAGGYKRFSRRWRTLTLSGPFQIADLRIELKVRSPWENKHFKLPKAKVVTLIPKIKI